MGRHRNEPDTDLGLPRKAVNKVLLIVVRCLGGLVCAGAVWFSHHLNDQLTQMQKSIDESNAHWTEMNLRVARIEWKLNIVADTSPKSVASTVPTP